jgi:hypothetical protein
MILVKEIYFYIFFIHLQIAYFQFISLQNFDYLVVYKTLEVGTKTFYQIQIWAPYYIGCPNIKVHVGCSLFFS